MFCAKCGTENAGDSKFCRNCGAALTPDTVGTPPTLSAEASPGLTAPVTGPLSQAPPAGYEAPNPPPLFAPKNHILAILSLVFGIVGLFCMPLFGLAALILGLIGLSKIRQSQGMVGGKGMAIAGTILGGAGMVLTIIFIILVIMMLPGMNKIKDKAKELKCQNNMRGLYMGLMEYESEYHCYPSERGAKFWDALRTYPTRPTSIFKGNKDDLYVCPICGDRPGSGVSDYRGPDFEVTDDLDPDTPILADLPHNHSDGSVNVLYFDGRIKKVQKGDDDWSRANKMLK